jgi:hypothetical protein
MALHDAGSAVGIKEQLQDMLPMQQASDIDKRSLNSVCFGMMHMS